MEVTSPQDKTIFTLSLVLLYFSVVFLFLLTSAALVLVLANNQSASLNVKYLLVDNFNNKINNNYNKNVQIIK